MINVKAINRNDRSQVLEIYFNSKDKEGLRRSIIENEKSGYFVIVTEGKQLICNSI